MKQLIMGAKALNACVCARVCVKSRNCTKVWGEGCG